MIVGVFGKEDKVKGMDGLEGVKILDKYEERCEELWGGEEEGIWIGRGLCEEGRMILGEEGVGWLDGLSRKEVMDELKKMNEEVGISILINLEFVDLGKE